MRLKWRTGFYVAATGLIAWGAGTRAQDAAPSLAHSIETSDYREVVSRPDGSALAVRKDAVILRDPAGGTRFVARLRGNQRVTTSTDAATFGVATYADNAPSTLHIARFDMYDRNGTKLFSLNKPRASEFRIVGDGKWIVGIAGGDGMLEANVDLYDENGKAVATWSVPNLAGLTFPDSGSRFFAASRGELLSLSYDGGEARSLGRYETFGASADGRWVALSGGGSLFVFDGFSLVFSGRTAIENVRTVSVSPEGRFVALSGGDRLELFGLENKELLWTVTSGQPGLKFMSVALSSQPLRILCGLDEDPGADAPQEQRHVRGAVFLFNGQGELEWREDLRYSRWNFSLPAVSFHRDHGAFEVRLADEQRQYTLP